MSRKPDSKDRQQESFFSPSDLSHVFTFPLISLITYSLPRKVTGQCVTRHSLNQQFPILAVYRLYNCTLYIVQSLEGCISQRPGHTTEYLDQNLGSRCQALAFFKTLRWIPMAPKWKGTAPKKCFSYLNMHTDHLWVLLKCKFWFRQSRDSVLHTNFQVMLRLLVHGPNLK